MIQAQQTAAAPLPASAPLIVTALFGPADFARLDGLRRMHFPSARNIVPAHLTLFHHLPPSEEPRIRDMLRSETSGVRRPAARLSAVRALGNGVAFAVQSPELEAIRTRLADAWAPLLIPQDRAGWRAHITIQNKVAPPVAKALYGALSAEFKPAPLIIAGLGLWRYLGGPWEMVRRFPFS